MLIRLKYITLWRLAALIILAGGGTGCTVFSTVTESLFMMTPKQESELGAEVARKVGQQYQFVQDPEVTNYITRVGQRIWANSPTSDFKARFAVVKDKSINAFAIPGGNIYVNSGLIAAADDEAELAAVIAHEAAHVTCRHAARQLSHEQGAALIQQVALGQQSPLVAQLATSIVKQGAMFTYSRADENQADAVAVATLARCGYDPLAMKRFFAKLTQTYGDTGPMAKWFSTHPPTRERIANVELQARNYPNAKREAPTAELRKVQGRLAATGAAK